MAKKLLNQTHNDQRVRKSGAPKKPSIKYKKNSNKTCPLPPKKKLHLLDYDDLTKKKLIFNVLDPVLQEMDQNECDMTYASKFHDPNKDAFWKFNKAGEPD